MVGEIEEDPDDEPETLRVTKVDMVEELDTLSETVLEADSEFAPLLELLIEPEVLFDTRAVGDVDEEPDVEADT